MAVTKTGTIDLVRVSSADFGKEIGRYQDMALNQPVVVTHDGQDRTVMISIEEYDRLKRCDRKVYLTEDLPAELVDSVGQAEMNVRHRHLDDLIPDWKP